MSQGCGALAAPPSVRTDNDAASPASRSRCSIGQSSTPLAMKEATNTSPAPVGSMAGTFTDGTSVSCPVDRSYAMTPRAPRVTTASST